MISLLYTIATSLALAAASGSGFVAVPFNRVQVNSTSAAFANKNAKVVQVPDVLKSTVYQYLATFELGEGQQQTAAIDTGSSDLWVYSESSGAPGGFDPSNSKFVNDGFEIGYVDGTTASGNYYIDKLKWGSADIDVQFAVDTKFPGSPSTGIFGIAFESTEASKYGPYPNYPQALKDQGVIEAVAYSLYLNDIDSNYGTLLFGAVDHSRYTGPLTELDIVSSSRLSVELEVAGHTIEGILDSGTSLTYLPDDIVSEIAYSLGATWNSAAGAWQAQGEIPDQGVTYTFGGNDIVVPKSELWLDLDGSDNGKFLTILPYSQASYFTLLGDTFLRSAYVVYNLEAGKIAIGQANWNPGSPDYEVITSAGIPGTTN